MDIEQDIEKECGPHLKQILDDRRFIKKRIIKQVGCSEEMAGRYFIGMIDGSCGIEPRWKDSMKLVELHNPLTAIYEHAYHFWYALLKSTWTDVVLTKTFVMTCERCQKPVSGDPLMLASSRIPSRHRCVSLFDTPDQMKKALSEHSWEGYGGPLDYGTRYYAWHGKNPSTIGASLGGDPGLVAGDQGRSPAAFRAAEVGFSVVESPDVPPGEFFLVPPGRNRSFRIQPGGAKNVLGPAIVVHEASALALQRLESEISRDIGMLACQGRQRSLPC